MPETEIQFGVEDAVVPNRALVVSLRKMTGIVSVYRSFCKTWLSLVVYLWFLELMAVYSHLDSEALIDRIADCSAILATLVFWVLVAGCIPMFASLLTREDYVRFISGWVGRAAAVLISAFYLLRWLSNWGMLLGDSEAPLYALVFVAALAAWFLWHRLVRKSYRPGPRVSLDDFWSCVTAPTLVTMAVILLIAVGGNLWTRRSSRLVSAKATENRPNVVLVVADGLRSESMSLYGYERATTTFLDQLGAWATVYERMYTNATSTRTSLTTILSGKHPFSHGRLTKFMPTYRNSENLIAVLRERGYTTAAVTSNMDASFHALGFVDYLVYGEVPNYFRLTLGFLRDNGVYATSLGNRMYDAFAGVMWFLPYPEPLRAYGTATETVKVAARLVRELPNPFFLYVHLHEPHDPYDVPLAFAGKFAKLRQDPRGFPLGIAPYDYFRPEQQPVVNELRDRYEESIAYMDFELAKLATAIDHRADAANTMYLLTSDHGESFDHGYLNHGDVLYSSSVHVPLVIRYPNQRVGQRVKKPVQSIDIAATIADAIGLDVPPWMDGIPLGRSVDTVDRDTIIVNFRDAFTGTFYLYPTKLAIQWRNHKLILSCENGQRELYDLLNDPAEQRNLVGSQPELVDKLERQLAGSLKKQEGTSKFRCPNRPTT